MSCVTEHLHHMACSVIEINICSQDLQEIIIYKMIKKTLLQSTKDILSETVIIFHVFMRKPVLQICAEQFKSGVEISDRSRLKWLKCVILEFFPLLLILLLKIHTFFLYYFTNSSIFMLFFS